ncbi:hypothetical protein LR48_Vigan02g070000 [Vigna angularis]|uniref:CTP synthase N-terminal domain-containing protein n=1 Tax=Phaseolus angularis TaxID=3914 RepID=A0A0L9TVH5_PHAAN|nr:hypothetical protein LR48_Vigan02g070000 [Vigna angularis]
MYQERRGDYLGKTVQVVAHITDAIQEWIERVAKILVDGKEGVAAEPNLKESTARKKIYDKCDETGADGVLVPGGFGDGGVQGKILAAKYA